MDKLDAVQQWLKHQDYAALLVPMADRFQSEYVPEDDRRLSWLTGFTGSAGFAVVMQDKAAFFTDGRYTLQAEHEVDKRFERLNSGVTSPAKWLKSWVTENKRIAYDPWLHTSAQLEPFRKLATLVPLTSNPLDTLWQSKPPPSQQPAFAHSEKLAGVSTAEKLTPLIDLMNAENLDAWLLTSPEIINWLLNIRGHDLPNTPVALSYAIIERQGAIHLFINPAKAAGLSGVKLHPLDDVALSLSRYSSLVYDETEVPSALLQPNAVIRKNPLLLAKACKNPVEQERIRQAHIRDGAALTAFFHWMLTQGIAHGLDEISLSEALYRFRAKGNLFHGESFPTIAGFKEHGAIIHYRAMPQSVSAITGNGLLLVDSGAQYLDGTTDVTRTFAIGTPTEEEREAYTRVLKGHIMLGNAVFPKGTTGHALDSLARYALWQGGLDYDHGTGHGVGYFLNVHEGPQNISKRFADVPLQPGMVLSNEPGYYKPGAFGIRIENLVMVKELPEFGEQGRVFYGFETLTQVPYDRRLIDVTSLSAEERNWINRYHQHVYETLTPIIEPAAIAWLKTQTAPL